jgi:ribosome modulation factor
MTDKNHAKAANPPKDPEDRIVFEQGRTAAAGSISKEDAPYDQSDARHKVWIKGWESVER